jgi:hypothetical protein
MASILETLDFDESTEVTDEIEFTSKQTEFAEALLSGNYRYLLYGGAIRGGKTVCALLLCIILARMYKGSRWAIVRKDLPTIKRNTLPSFKRIAFSFRSRSSATRTSTAGKASKSMDSF